MVNCDSNGLIREWPSLLVLLGISVVVSSKLYVQLYTLGDDSNVLDIFQLFKCW